MEKMKKLKEKIQQSMKSIGEKFKALFSSVKEAIGKLANRVKKSPKIVKTVAVYTLVLTLMFGFMAWQRSKLPFDIITNNPPVENPAENDETDQPNDSIDNTQDNTQDDDENQNDDNQAIDDDDEVESVFRIEENILWPIDGFREIEGRFTEEFYFRDGGQPYILDGILIPAPKGSKVRAALSGVVIDVVGRDVSFLYGSVVKVRYEDPNNVVWETIYYNLDQIQVEKGQNISPGDSLGYVGSNLLASKFKEEHIVFELKKNSAPIDPEPYF